MQRPFPSPGFGWIVALLVLIVSVLVLVAHVAVDPWLGILALALAILL